LPTQTPSQIQAKGFAFWPILIAICAVLLIIGAVVKFAWKGQQPVPNSPDQAESLLHELDEVDVAET
jgi:hypothetical protein